MMLNNFLRNTCDKVQWFITTLKSLEYMNPENTIKKVYRIIVESCLIFQSENSILLPKSKRASKIRKK